jgi:hypothetical protein
LGGRRGRDGGVRDRSTGRGVQDGGVAEGSDRVCVEAEGGGLEQNVLGDMAGLDVHVANGPVAVFDRRACEDDSSDEDDRCDEDDRWVADRIGAGPLTEIQGNRTPEEREGRTWLIRP